MALREGLSLDKEEERTPQEVPPAESGQGLGVTRESNTVPARLSLRSSGQRSKATFPAQGSLGVFPQGTGGR